MSIAKTALVLVAIIGTIAALAAPRALAQADPCASQNQRQACSMQCCGRRSCPPSCEVDCVKACVDACASPALMPAYKARLKEMQIRCGNKSVK
jgi:hypothetical protein